MAVIVKDRVRGMLKGQYKVSEKFLKRLNTFFECS
jgi:hypothetical protein